MQRIIARFTHLKVQRGNKSFNNVLFGNKQSSRAYSSLVSETNAVKVNPWFFTGFTDAEGTFTVKISKSDKYRTGWKVEPLFAIGLHIKDVAILNAIQNTLGGIGAILNQGEDGIQFVISSQKDLQVLMSHFENYPLITQKRADFEIFKRILEIVSNKGHLNNQENGLQEIVNLRATLNLGLSDALKNAFPNTVPVAKPLVEDLTCPHPQWLAGFTSGEGCFSIKVRKGSTKIGYRVELAFILTQHTRDEQLLKNLVTYLGCGKYYKQANNSFGNLRCENFTDIFEILIPFFKEHKIVGVKALDFEDWCQAADLIKTKDHLTNEGLEKIRQLQLNMNRSRKN